MNLSASFVIECRKYRVPHMSKFEFEFSLQAVHSSNETSGRLDSLFMKTEVQDIEMLERAILTEARDEAEQIKAEAKEKVEAIRKRAQEQAEQERKAILERAQRGRGTPPQPGNGNSPIEGTFHAVGRTAKNCLTAFSKTVKEKLADGSKAPGLRCRLRHCCSAKH